MEYFWRHGYRATGIDELTRWLGISRSSLYSVWNGKDELFRAAFERYLRTVGMEALRPLNAAVEGDPHPREVIESVFETVAEQVSQDPWRRGCMMVNTITELSAVEPELARLAHRASDEVRTMFRTALEPLVAMGERSAVRADNDADFLLTLFVGLRVLARSGPARERALAVAHTGLDAVFG